VTDDGRRAEASPASAPRVSPAKRFSSFDRRWGYFFIDDLNGLCDQRRLAIETQDHEQVALVEAKVGRILTSLAWNAENALRSAYEFARKRISYPEDAWGPALVIGALEPDRAVFPRWLQSLPPEVQQDLAPLPLALERIRPATARPEGNASPLRHRSPENRPAR
jgi:hypothetical protein